MPARPAPADRPLPLARASARLEFDDLLRRRTTALAEGIEQRDLADPEKRHRLEASRLIDGLGREFADAVDRHNAAEQEHVDPSRRHVLDYADAVMLRGDRPLVVDAEAYSREPVYWQATAGEVDLVVFGRDLDGYLRTGEARYETALGLA